MKENRLLDAKLVKMQAEIFKLENETIDLDEYCKPFEALKDGNK